jgi:hypothetical protein
MHPYLKKEYSTNTVFKKKRKEKRKKNVDVCTKDVSKIREKRQKSNNMAYPKNEKNFETLLFSCLNSRVKINENKFVSKVLGFFSHISTKKEEDFQCFVFPIQCDKKKRKVCINNNDKQM